MSPPVNSVMSARSERQWRPIFCPHCGSSVSKSTYYRHRDRYYDPIADKWESIETPARDGTIVSRKSVVATLRNIHVYIY